MDKQGEHRYGMMIDAGSEGSRLVVFRWEAVPQKELGRKIATPTAVGNISIVPGIGSFALRPEQAGPSLAPLLEYAQETLRDVKDHWKYMPIFLRATAGMRLLHADEREAVLQSVRRFLGGSGFYFRDEHAMVITGEEEGVYGWITINHWLGKLYVRDDSAISWKTTVGSLDLGGASTQVTFIPEKSIMSHAFPIQLGSHRFRVYSWSFLHFGQREAAHRSTDVIISAALQQVQSIDKLEHPCFSLGYVYRPRFAYSDNRTFPMTVSMQGSANFQQCEQLIRKTFEKEAPCLVESCSFYGVYQPHVYTSRFVAFSHFADVASNLALPADAQLRDLKVATEYVCSLSLDQLNLIFARVKNDYDRLHLCFHSAYAYILLTYGYGFPEQSTQVVFQSNFSSGEPIDYIVGAMIYELNQDPWLVKEGAVPKQVRKHPATPAPPPWSAPAPPPPSPHGHGGGDGGGDWPAPAPPPPHGGGDGGGHGGGDSPGHRAAAAAAGTALRGVGAEVEVPLLLLQE